MTNNDCHDAAVDFRKELGQRVKAERKRLRYSAAGAARDAGMARDTWNKIERGQSVQDHNLEAALRLLGLDERGDHVGGDEQDAQQYVESLTGERVPSGVTNEDLLREIVRSRAEADQIRATVTDIDGRLEALSTRVAKLEEPGA